MSRPIKYRAWDGKRMWTPTADNDFAIEFYVDGSVMCSCVEDGRRVFVESVEEVVQFTGLHDTEGTEIWEGDVVAINQDGPHRVVFDEGSFIANGQPLAFVQGIVVTGNIYKNVKEAA